MNFFKIKSIFIITFCLFLNYSFSQKSNFEESFNAFNLQEKITFYNSLNDSARTLNSNFLKSDFEFANNNVNGTLINHQIKMIIAQLDYYSGDYIQSINLLKSILEDKNNKLQAKDSMLIYDDLKKSYYKLYLYPEIFEANSNIKKLIENGAKYPLWSYNMNSKLYSRLSQYDKAILELKKEILALERSKNEDFLIIPSAYNDLGYYYFVSKKYDSALVHFNTSLAYANKFLTNVNNEQYKQISALVKGNIAEVYIERKMFKEAVPLLIEDVKVGVKSKINFGSTIHSSNLLVECYLELGDFKKANKVFEQIKPFIIKLSDNPALVDYLKNKADYYHKIKQTDSSNYYFNEAFRIKDALDTSGMNKVLASNELMFSISEEHKVYEKYKSDLKNQEINQKINQKNILIFFTICLSILLFLSFYNTFKLKKSKKEIRKKSIEITEKNNEIEQALSEKNILLKEVHHRVKNNLQVISGLLELQNISVTDDGLKLALKEGQNRIQSVALVHKMMYQSENVSKVNMQQYLEELTQVLELSYKKQNQKIVTKIDALMVDIDIILAVPISLIVNEAVCNIYKHAFKNKFSGNIYISMSKVNATTYTLVIKDDGVGLPNNFDLLKLKTIGFDLIKGLSKQIKGKLEVKNNKGTEIHILFKESNII